MTAPRKRPARRRMQRLLDRLRVRYEGSERAVFGDGIVTCNYFRYWLANSNITDEDMQEMAEYNLEEGRYSCARFMRLMCFTSKTTRKLIR